ncbi:hypothetical protein HELRODRAFT_188509 [Helobdella robusta]|uniref:EF-hand domain-containing protein n=1 Tax=Helobdella robusta TaxID=6412 RepID=T1FQ28_HELRO|nr:hypothetical protein HELRODRAFT_188509 [Helobdella robusta]ESO01885.1 hypothetical protein HELRODRAFT_188509 [Helobdella robusta]
MNLNFSVAEHELLLFLSLSLLCSLAVCHEAVNPILGDIGGHQHTKQEHEGEHEPEQVKHAASHEEIGVKFNSSVIHNKEHIIEHLDGYAKQPEEMNSDELQFHYFKLHDTNNDNELDGLELLQAFLHEHKEENDEEPAEDKKNHNLNLEHIVPNVDYILKLYDKNDDGKVSYPEFVSSIKLETNDSPDQHQQQPPPPAQHL